MIRSRHGTSPQQPADKPPSKRRKQETRSRGHRYTSAPDPSGRQKRPQGKRPNRNSPGRVRADAADLLTEQSEKPRRARIAKAANEAARCSRSRANQLKIEPTQLSALPRACEGEPGTAFQGPYIRYPACAGVNRSRGFGLDIV